MKKFKCWILSSKYGWLVFEKDFASQEEALRYCESKAEFKKTSIVEEMK